MNTLCGVTTYVVGQVCPFLLPTGIGSSEARAMGWIADLSKRSLSMISFREGGRRYRDAAMCTLLPGRRAPYHANSIQESRPACPPPWPPWTRRKGHMPRGGFLWLFVCFLQMLS